MARKKRVLITGGAQGIGFAAAELFLERGYEVAIWALHADSVQKAVSALGGRVFGQTVDVGSEEQVKTAYQQLAAGFGTVDILVNNAGYTLTSRFLDEDADYWRRVVDTNLWGVIYTTRAVLGDMVAAESGSIVNVVSDAGRVGMAGEAVYAASKGGVVAFSKSIAQETARYRVRVNCVSPGPTRTRILAVNSEDEDAQKLIDKMIRRIPLRKIAEPRDVAEAIVFLASGAASQITGQVLSVSGGLTMV
ncbi:SDR family NAD(P)-dependent oxidoreductase [Alicyclobacillus shizuokensis]|uniref:SDR family NAD(P)-dependent oxidoreductase n=1 Tax=Alicyclobacillus shizuokensis TaxID=392014 RepID=UPI0008378406|nr:SDR family NAD(P)-dependent oxidoreductase [Alicyclobacillus shizuokensis]